MASHKEVYVTHLSTSQIFNIVADIEKYPEFLPWCSGARIIKRSKNTAIAELSINFAAFSYKYTSEVKFSPPKTEHGSCSINVELVEGPFDSLTNRWKFERVGTESRVTFEIDFQPSSSILDKMLGFMFTKAIHKITDAFQKRAREIYN